MSILPDERMKKLGSKLSYTFTGMRQIKKSDVRVALAGQICLPSHRISPLLSSPKTDNKSLEEEKKRKKKKKLKH